MPTKNFTDLYASSFGRLVGQVTMVTADRQAAEDAVQEAFGRLWNQWESLSTHGSPEAWVRRVAINVAISRWRRLRRLRPLGDIARAAREDDPVARQDLQRALQALPLRQPLLLHHVVGLPVAAWPRRWARPRAR